MQLMHSSSVVALKSAHEFSSGTNSWGLAALRTHLCKRDFRCRGKSCWKLLGRAALANVSEHPEAHRHEAGLWVPEAVVLPSTMEMPGPVWWGCVQHTHLLALCSANPPTHHHCRTFLQCLPSHLPQVMGGTGLLQNNICTVSAIIPSSHFYGYISLMFQPRAFLVVSFFQTSCMLGWEVNTNITTALLQSSLVHPC